MKITIDVPEMKCTKCDTTAAVQPHMLFSKSQPPALFREAFTPLMKTHTDATAIDDLGNVWGVLADDKPAGWVKGPQGIDLCAPCGALWRQVEASFLAAPPPVEIADEASDDGEPLPAAPSFVYGSIPQPVIHTRR